MAETIASLGGVPLGRAGTGTAVILGEKDYSYLKPERIKPEKYTPLIGDDEIKNWLKEAGTVWKPDQAKGREKVNELITKTKQMELLNKAGEKEAARKKYDEIQQDALGFGQWVKNSKDNEASGTKFETDWRNNSLLYDQGDWDEYLKWQALDPNERSRNVPSQRADDLNYVPYVIKNITAQIKPDKDTVVQDRGGFRDTKTNTYYTEDEVKRAALASAYMTSGKYLNMWRQKMMNKAVMDDPMTDVNEAELATQIIANLGDKGVSPELYDFIAGQNYLLFSGNMEKVERKKAPAPAEKAAGGRGGAGGKATVSVVTGQVNDVLTDPTTGAKRVASNVKYQVALGQDKSVNLPFIVDRAYAEGYLKDNPDVKELFESAGGEGLPDQYVVKGDPQSIIYDPQTKSEYLRIATKVGDKEKTILIPYKKLENQAKLESKWMNTEQYKQNKTSLRKFLDNFYKSPQKSPSTEITPPPTKSKKPTAGAPKPAGGGAAPSGRRGTFDKKTGKIVFQ